MMIPKVFKDNRELPWCFYYLGVAEYLLQEVQNNTCLWNIEDKIQEIQVYITIAGEIYAGEIYAGETKTQKQTKGFCQKKRIIKANLDKLKVKCMKKKQENTLG